MGGKHSKNKENEQKMRESSAIYKIGKNKSFDLGINEINLDKGYLEYLDNEKCKSTIKHSNTISYNPLEKEIKEKFHYFNICWFDPNHSNDCEILKPIFENVKMKRSYDIESVTTFFEDNPTVEDWIVITPGSKGEDLISKIHECSSIKAFIIYCFKPEVHKEWATKYDKVKGVVNKPSLLYKVLLKINEDYVLPKFNYELPKKYPMKNFRPYINKIEGNYENKYAANSFKREFQLLLNDIKHDGNKYSLFCVKRLNEFKVSKKNKEEEFFNSLLETSTLISLYFSKYSFIYNSLEYEEVKSILTEEEFNKVEPKLYYFEILIEINLLCFEIKKNKSILNRKSELKKFHIFLIRAFIKNMIVDINFYQIINLLRDIDFTLKLFMRIFYYRNKEIQLFKELKTSLNASDDRIANFYSYLNMGYRNIKIVDEETKKDQEILKEALLIKDFMVIGNSKFHKNIKKIENGIKYNSIEYTNINLLKKKIKERMKRDNSHWIFDYFIIINEEDAEKYFTEISLIVCELGLRVILIILVENEKSLISKQSLYFNFNIQKVITYSTKEIELFLKNDNYSKDLPTTIEDMEIENKKLSEIFKLEEIKILQNKINEGWSLIDEKQLNENIIKNIIIKKSGESISMIDDYISKIYEVFVKKGQKELFLKDYSKYFGLSIHPESLRFDLNLAKLFLYAYSKEEREGKSFYKMMNEDLWSGESLKMVPYLEIIALLYQLINDEELASYTGELYRGTYLTDELINELKIGKIMLNSSFWSTSKDLSIAIKFLQRSKKNNTLIYVKANKNNVDIDYEEISRYPKEKEVLLLPFSSFEVENIEKKNISGKDVTILKLKCLEVVNKCNRENMKSLNLDSLKYQDYLYDN